MGATVRFLTVASFVLTIYMLFFGMFWMASEITDLLVQ